MKPRSVRKLPDHPDSPWQTERRRTVYQNRWLTLEEDQVITPAGERGIYGVVRAAHVALGIVPVDDQHHTWLVGQYRYPLNRYSWEIPEGGGDPELDLLGEAQRELLEETGLRARCWKPLLELDTSNCFTDEKALVFLATDIEIGCADPEPTEQLELLRLPLVEACQLAADGQIRDAISIAGLFQAARQLSLSF